MKFPRFEACGCCHGTGLVPAVDGSPRECESCEGIGRVMARDARGRFLPWEDLEDTFREDDK